MKALLAALAGGAFALALAATAFAAPSGVFTVMVLHGHLPDLGETASLRVFQTAAAYDDFHRALGGADIFPAASALSVGFDRNVLALYSRGADAGDRCLAMRGGATVNGDAIELALAWQDGTCGAPAGAHYPFILASLSRNGNDGDPWLGVLRSVCAAAPGVDGSRACASVAGPLATAVPKTPAPSSQPASAVPSGSAVAVAPRDEPVATPSSVAVSTTQAVGFVGIGLIFGVIFAVVYTRWRRSHGARTGVTREAPSRVTPTAVEIAPRPHTHAEIVPLLQTPSADVTSDVTSQLTAPPAEPAPREAPG